MNTEFCEQKRYLKTGDRTKNIKIPILEGLLKQLTTVSNNKFKLSIRWKFVSNKVPETIPMSNEI